jgi:amidohydrolase
MQKRCKFLSDVLREKVILEVDSLRDRIIEIGDYIHANPELGHQEYKAAELLTSELRKHGFKVVKGIKGMDTAFKAELHGKASGPKIAFLAEYDSLPPPLGHGCGHNLMASMSIGAGIALSKLMPELSGSIYVFGTPAEEGIVDNCGGKVIMADEFKEMDAAMIIHPGDKTTNGVTYSWNREGLELEFLGAPANAGNAMSTSQGVNALEACMLFWHGLNTLRPHIREGGRIFGIVTEGGVSPNVVPERAVTRLQIRVPTYNYFLEVVEKVKTCAQGAAAALGAKVNIRAYANRYLAFLPNFTLAEAFGRNIESLGMETVEPTSVGGATDMGNVSRECPSIHPSIQIMPKGTPGHSYEAAKASFSDRGREAAIVGAKSLALTAVDLFTGKVNVEKMKKEFMEAKKMG